MITILLSSIVDIVTGYQLTEILQLNTQRVTVNSEFWRLFTYPFTFLNIESLTLAIIAFGIFSPKIERKYKNFMLPIMLFLLSVMHSTVFNWLFMFDNQSMGGSEGLSIFVLSFFFLNNPKAKVKIMNMAPFSARNLILGIFTIWAMVIFFKISNQENHQALNSTIFGSLGLVNALVLYLQIKLVDRYRNKKYQQHTFFEQEELTKIEKDELSLALIASQQKKFNQRKDERFVISSDPLLNEERANELLDKISLNGYESLDPSEVRFLEDYSNNL